VSAIPPPPGPSTKGLTFAVERRLRRLRADLGAHVDGASRLLRVADRDARHVIQDRPLWCLTAALAAGFLAACALGCAP
jgi:hypothetical protein